MTKLGDLADWWTGRKNETYRLFAEFAVENEDNVVLFYGTATVAVLTGMAMELGEGFVDVLRLGEGVQQGGWGYAQDGLRLLVIAGPALRVVKLGGAKAMKLYVDPLAKSGVCGWISSTQALRHTGNRLFATVDDLAKAAGMKVPGAELPVGVAKIGGSNLKQLADVMRKLGARVDAVGGMKTLADVQRLARTHADDVIQIGIKWVPTGAKDMVGHAVYVYRNAAGKVKIVDRSGNIVDDLAGLSHIYAGIENAVLVGNSVNRIHTAAVIKVSEKLITLGLPMNSYFAGSKGELEESYEAFKIDRESAGSGGGRGTFSPPSRGMPAVTSGGRPNGAQGNGGASANGTSRRSSAMVTGGPASITHHYVVKPGDSLSRIAKSYYGSAKHWRAIYQANKALIGRDPHVIKPGTRLMIPTA